MEDEKAKAGTEETPMPLALLMDLEGAMIQGRQGIYETVRKIMSQHGVDVTSVMFSRYVVDRRPKEYVPDLLKVGGQKGKGPGDITGALEKHFTETTLKLSPGVDKALAWAEKKGLKLGVVSSLFSDETVEAMLKGLGLDERISAYKSCAPMGKGYPSTDLWRRLAASVEVETSRCVAVVGSARPALSAISAHMRCIVVPDEFTSYQDFSGSDAVQDVLDVAIIQEIVASVEDEIA